MAINGNATDSIVSSTCTEEEAPAAAAAPEEKKSNRLYRVESNTDCSDEDCRSEEMEYGDVQGPNVWESEGEQDEVWHEAERRYALAQAKEDVDMEEEEDPTATTITTTTTTTTTTSKNGRPQLMVEEVENKRCGSCYKDNASDDLFKTALMSTLAASTRLMATLATTPPFFPSTSTPPGFAYTPSMQTQCPPPPPQTSVPAQEYQQQQQMGQATMSQEYLPTQQHPTSMTSSMAPPMAQRIYAQRPDGVLEYLGNTTDQQRPNAY